MRTPQRAVTLARDLTVGVDCEDIARWRGLMRTLKTGGFGRAFSASETAYCLAQADPAPHFAARWCAKEAVVKALSAWIAITVREVGIENGARGRPTVRVRHHLASAFHVEVSLSHSRTHAVAVAIASRRPEHPPLIEQRARPRRDR
jgi:holo-[acyl-carrier protein] synthase